MSILTLTSDFGIKDHYVASVKGQILSWNPMTQIIDISHCIDAYNLGQSAYVWMGAYPHFPKNTCHFILVDSEVEDYDQFVVAKKDGQWVFVADNGWVSILAPYVTFDEIYIFTKEKKYKNTYELYLEVWDQMCSGTDINDMAIKVALHETHSMSNLQPIVSDDQLEIRGAVIYDDHYGNVVTNISKTIFEEIGQGRPFQFRVSRYNMNRIHKSYSDFNTDVKPLKEFEGDSLLLFNDVDLLQISIYKSSPSTGTVKSLFGLRYQDTVIVQFFNEPKQ